MTNYEKLKAKYYEIFSEDVIKITHTVPYKSTYIKSSKLKTKNTITYSKPDIDIREVLRMMSSKIECKPNTVSLMICIKKQEIEIQKQMADIFGTMHFELPLKEQEELCGKLLELLK